MKKLISFTAVCIVLMLCLAGCSKSEQSEPQQPEPQQIDKICGTWQGTSYYEDGRDNLGWDYLFGNDLSGRRVRDGIYNDRFNKFSPSNNPIELYMIVEENGTATLYTDDPSDGEKNIYWGKNADNKYSFAGCECIMAGNQISIAIDKEENAKLNFKKISD